MAIAPLAARGAVAQDAAATYPSRAVTMVVAFPPGGQADVVARPVAAALERIWRVPVPVVNRGGAGGAIGNAFVARAAPDGYTLLMALSSLAVLPEADRLHGRPPAYTVDQFAPIALITADPTLLVVRADSPWRTLEELIEDAKRRPGQITYSSAGNYSTLHVAMAMFTSAAGIDLLHVPYQGGGPALTALLSGTVQALASGPGPITPHVREGKLRPLACWGARRAPGYEDVPTFIEKGFRDVEFYIWAGVFAPAATPAAIQERIRAALRQAVADPELRRALEAAGSPIAYLDGEAFERFFREDSARLIRAVQRIGKVD
ncbi:tripartite tricarboxylate transporter substrate binding protein [Caldovatus aquaticus]|uniref:Tripartite tricarboxylate transporter substrate binding protein n=1 Tax=Caldovatus aquaticus TaxID=2865671 RepID=A0ABS7EZF2_9PROT|nr:tripartite tricarboxylate transporter substrate binding protein [Caldovatus aquaticus]MBW8268756.1 tripartite tricarboxylate transporter substrate binding protein [Caldovatus aquaticus]